MLMVESKQNLAVAPSRTDLGKASLELKSCEEWPDMPSPHPPRINVHELKAQIIMRVGSKQANQYFSHFRSFIGSLLSKQELDKFVVVTIGRENVALHNQLIKAIISNAVHCSHGPPPPPTQDVSKPVKGVRRHTPPSITIDDDNVLQPSSSTLSNRNSFLFSPHGRRSYTLRDPDYKANKDTPSPFGPQEEHSTPDLSRPMQQLEHTAKQLDSDSNTEPMPPSKRLRIHETMSTENSSAKESSMKESGCSAPEGNFMVKEERKKALPSTSESIQAPLGIAFHSAVTRRPSLQPFPADLLLEDGAEEELLEFTDLPDNETMHRNMEQIAAVEGLEGVSGDCANVLNLALDLFLKRLVKACVDLVGSRARTADHGRPVLSGATWDENIREGIFSGRSLQGKNGVWLGPPAETFKKGREKVRSPISLTDFKVAMDLNPQQLGEDWPVQLEKISFRRYDSSAQQS